MKEHSLDLKSTLQALPALWSEPVQPAIRARLAEQPQTVVVIDDDPTGTQTVHDVPVLTEWNVDSLRAELAGGARALYLLTNSRSMPAPAAEALNRGIGRELVHAARQAQRRFVVVSRSDSTLRGHFPGEVDALRDGLGQRFDAWLLIPCFEEGGRYTIDDTQYVAVGSQLVPAAATPFARDAAFGYRSSNLRAWVEEKTGGRVPAGAVASISLDDIRRGGPPRVAERLAGLDAGVVCIVNAAARGDLEVFVAGLLEAEAAGRRYLYRTAASFVPLRAGISPRALLTATELDLPSFGAGLIVAGSYVPATTDQLAALRADAEVTAIELDVEAVLDPDRADKAVEHIARAVDRSLATGHDTLLMTSRAIIRGTDVGQSLAIGQRVSRALVQIVRRLTLRPRYLVAKGGITANDLATRALDVRRAMVQGQLAPGVPVWRLGDDSRYPGLIYVVFPGNVGEPHTLHQLVQQLRRGAPAVED